MRLALNSLQLLVRGRMDQFLHIGCSDSALMFSADRSGTCCCLNNYPCLFNAHQSCLCQSSSRNLRHQRGFYVPQNLPLTTYLVFFNILCKPQVLCENPCGSALSVQSHFPNLSSHPDAWFKVLQIILDVSTCSTAAFSPV